MRILLLPAVALCAGLGVASSAYTADIAPGIPEAKVVESESGWTWADHRRGVSLLGRRLREIVVQWRRHR